MTPTPAKRIRAAARKATRQALLRAGVEEMIARGGVLPSIEAVCARAGYTRGAFYVHFKNRRDFVVEMLELVAGDIFQRIFRRAGGGESDLRAIITRFATALVERDWPDVSDIRAAYMSVITALRESDGVRERHASLMNAATDRLEAAIRDGQGDGTLVQSIEPRKTAQLLLLLAVGLIVWDDVGIPLQAQELTGSFLELIEQRDKTR